MNGPEFKLLRRSLFLSGRQVAQRLGIKSDRTIRYWEAGRAPVPADAAAYLLGIDAAIERVVDSALRLAGNSRDGLALLTFVEDDDVPADVADDSGLPAGPGLSDLHQAMTARLWRALATAGVENVLIVYFDRDAFERWRLAEHLDETPATRAQWAAGQAD